MLLLPLVSLGPDSSCYCQAKEDITAEEEEEHPGREYYTPEEVWSSWAAMDIYWWLGCEEDHHDFEHNPEAFPVHNALTWRFLRQAYRETVGEDQSSLPPSVDDEDEGESSSPSSGFQVPVQVLKTEERGRGNYAMQAIPAGTLIWTSKYTAQFTTAEQYRSFLQRLPPALACDVLIWAYTRWTTPSGTHAVACVDLDSGSFTNHADTDEQWNMNLGKNDNDDAERKRFHNTGCKLGFYAIRDIAKGEELAIDYDFSAYDPGWADMGLGPPTMEEENDDDYYTNYYYGGGDHDQYYYEEDEL